MKLSIKKLPRSQVELEIEVSAEEFGKFIERATFALGKDLEVQGFRKGKVPREVIEREMGREKILVQAVEQAVKENYVKAILDNKIEAISPPEIEILKLPTLHTQAPGNLLRFRAKTIVLPKIDLPDYKKIASDTKRRKVLIVKKEVEDALSWLQKSRAKFILKNKPAEKKDFVEIEFSSPQIKGNIKQHDNFLLGEGHFVEGFEENLVNMVAGEEKEFSVLFPKNYFLKDLAGKKIHFKVKMKSVRRVIFPEINNQLAKSLGRFENLTALKESIKKGLKMEKENQESQRVRQEILGKLMENSKTEIPEILIETEKKRMLEDIKKLVTDKFKISFLDYLTKIKKTEKELLDTFSLEAKRKVKNFLVLREISQREKIEVSENEIKVEINKFLKTYPSVERAEKELDSEKLKSYYREAIRNEKTLQFLEKLSSR